MNPLVKKEIRLLRPSWTAAMLLALVQAVTRPYDFYVASLLFFGLTIMALTTFGRETSLNTFSSLVALPAERIRIWQTKLSVLAGAFLMVFAVWLAAFGIWFLRSDVDLPGLQYSYNLFITVCLIATATFTGGLWTTLLLRQLAGAFWITLLVPATLAGFAGVFLAGSGASDHLVIAVLSVVMGVYSVAGFLFARWLFFHAQDVGWSGGVIALPEWKFLSGRAGTVAEGRKRQPIFALLKKELLLQQGVLTGAAGLLVLHTGIIGLRVVHQFPKDSAGEGVGEILTSIVWMLWLVLPVLLGSISVAEERKFGMMESQLCLPASRRAQFAIKAFVTLGLGVLLGGVMPILLESIGVAVGSRNQMFKSDHHPLDPSSVLLFLYGTMAFSAWTTLLGMFASSLARSFLQAIGIALVTFVGLVMCVPAFTSERMVFFASIAPQSLLPFLVAVPTLIIALAWLTWLNFKNFREGWPLWRRLLLGAVGAFVFIVAGSAAIYHRAWEVLEPAEPAHGPAQFSLANPPVIHHDDEGYDLLVQLPDGRVWFDTLGYHESRGSLRYVIQTCLDPFPGSTGPQRFVAGSNWVSMVVRHIYRPMDKTGKTVPFSGYLETVGVQADGTLWVSDKSFSPTWAGDRLKRYGDETNWQAVSWPYDVPFVVLLQKDGTLWHWGADQWAAHQTLSTSPALREFSPSRIGMDSDWKEIAPNNGYAKKADGSVWSVGVDPRSGEIGITRAAKWVQVDLGKIPQRRFPFGKYVRRDGTLWTSYVQRNPKPGSQYISETHQIGLETNWVSTASLWSGALVALKSDGTLWQRGLNDQTSWAITDPPTRLGIHHDWVAVAAVQNEVVSLAADGSLWLWPNREIMSYQQPVLKLPKQPKFLGNVLTGSKSRQPEGLKTELRGEFLVAGEILESK